CLTFLAASLLSPLLTEGAEAPTAETHRAEVEAWRARRMASLKRDDGWLTLVGLFWLEPGENRFGTDPKGNRIVFPEGSGEKSMGSLVLSGGSVRLRVKPESKLTADGQPATEMTLKSDADGQATVLDNGRIRFYLIKRGSKLGVRV